MVRITVALFGCFCHSLKRRRSSESLRAEEFVEELKHRADDATKFCNHFANVLRARRSLGWHLADVRGELCSPQVSDAHTR